MFSLYLTFKLCCRCSLWFLVWSRGETFRADPKALPCPPLLNLFSILLFTRLFFWIGTVSSFHWFEHFGLCSSSSIFPVAPFFLCPNVVLQWLSSTDLLREDPVLSWREDLLLSLVKLNSGTSSWAVPLINLPVHLQCWMEELAVHFFLGLYLSGLFWCCCCVHLRAPSLPLGTGSSFGTSAASLGMVSLLLWL